MAELGVRYVVAIAGLTSNADRFGVIGRGPYGCGGLAWWKRQTDIAVVVWDIRDVTKTDLRVTSAGTAIVPAFVLPIPFIPLTETKACDDIGQRLGEVLWR